MKNNNNSNNISNNNITSKAQDESESEKKNLILCETLKIVENEQNKNIFEAETFERIAAIINSRFYNVFAKTMEKIPNVNVSKKIKIKLLKIITCFTPATNRINYAELRKLISEGLPEELPELRSILWKLFLNYYPNNLNEWEEFSKEKSDDYQRLKGDLLSGDEKEKYKSLIYEITADVTRTRTDMSFFSKINLTSTIYINNSCLSNNTSKRNNKSEDNNNINSGMSSTGSEENLGDLLTRILLVFAILHPDISYIQGMNEILATIYFCFAKSKEIYLESELFYCFENFMLEVKDIYLKENDHSSRGIHGIVKTIEGLLEYQDIELSEHFKNIGIEINFFVLRWILIFFSQEFFMPETLRLWDSLIIETDKIRFITYVCLSVITKKRDDLLSLGFADIMFTMQNLKTLDFTIDEILLYAKQLQIILDKMYLMII